MPAVLACCFIPLWTVLSQTQCVFVVMARWIFESDIRDDGVRTGRTWSP
jgi:hypothetical protein